MVNENSSENNRSFERDEPTADQILAEAERRLGKDRRGVSEDEASSQMSPFVRRLVIGIDRLVFWLTGHWLAIANTFAFLYVGLPILAPVLMKIGSEGAARVIYTIYRPLCHQLPYRSWFLFGAQWQYSQAELAELVGEAGLVAHGYLGDPWMGFKVALCQRDVAIYGTIFLAGLIYAVARRRIRPMPFWAYLLFGVLPMGLDGGLQFISYLVPFILPSLNMPPLESNPIRRTITGALFGLSTAWLAYPHIEDAFDEIRTTLEQRFGW